MISCLLIHASHNPQGFAARKESIITGESIQIGRCASCKIHLPDHRVSLLHATVKQSEDGALYIEGEKDAVININGFVEQSAALSPGMRIGIGPYLLAVEAAPQGHDIALSVEMPQPLPEQDTAETCRATPVTLAGLRLSKRKLGFRLAACVLLLFLLLPLLPSVSSTLDKWQATLPVTMSESWSPGPLAGGHSMFSAKCSTCHQHALRAVPDDVCTGCHKQVAKHLAKDDLHAKVFKDTRCTACHLDHGGRAELMLYSSAECITCHGDLKGRKAGTMLANVHDFATDHPPFRITLRDGEKIIRIRQDEKEKLVEKSQLKFSHQVHLDKKGISTPMGDTVMVCRDCHLLDEAGTHFAPMTMRTTCQQSQCHSLYFKDPVDGIIPFGAERVVPHGSEREVMNKLRKFYVKWLTDSPARNTTACTRARGGGNTVQRTLECANDLAQKNAAARLFKENLGCSECHEIEPTGNGEVPWKVRPLHITRDWQPGAVFVHSKHGTADCTECHDKMNSKVSADIAMPTIEKCRECHVGNRAVMGKIRSTCDSCHRFHQG